MNEKPPLGARIADAVATFSGSTPFLFINLAVFTLWILANTIAPKVAQFDPYPYQFLTMSVSLEAIFLSIFVLISQNRQSEKDRQRAEQDLQVDLKGEAEIRDIMQHLSDQDEKITQLLTLLQTQTTPSHKPTRASSRRKGTV